jgi:hypothetical protein
LLDEEDEEEDEEEEDEGSSIRPRPISFGRDMDRRCALCDAWSPTPAVAAAAGFAKIE